MSLDHTQIDGSVLPEGVCRELQESKHRHSYKVPPVAVLVWFRHVH